MNLSTNEQRVVLKRQGTQSRLHNSKGIQLVTLTQTSRSSLPSNRLSFAPKSYNEKQINRILFTQPASNCNSLCSFNFDDMQKGEKNQILFQEQPDDRNCYEYQQPDQTPKAPSSKTSIQLEDIRRSARMPPKLVCPPTPINKLSHIDSEMNLKKLRPKGIMLVSCQQKEVNKGAYQSTQISRTASNKFMF